ncbi:hypothetical protein JHK87_019936 [Glycine soja]|nr:hypothetical protein JHK87_019936 [Glycine soja]
MPMEDEVMSEVAAPPRLVFLVSAGASHSVALLTGNVVCSWGRVEDGQLGHGDTDDRLLPTKLSALDGQDIICVTCGADHTMARSESGRDGRNQNGELGLGTTEDSLLPQKIQKFEAFSVDGSSGQHIESSKPYPTSERIWSREVEVAHGSGGVEVNGTKVCAVTRLIGAACAVMGLVGAVLAPEEVVQAVPRRRGDGVLIVMAVRW